MWPGALRATDLSSSGGPRGRGDERRAEGPLSVCGAARVSCVGALTARSSVSYICVYASLIERPGLSRPRCVILRIFLARPRLAYTAGSAPLARPLASHLTSARALKLSEAQRAKLALGHMWGEAAAEAGSHRRRTSKSQTNPGDRDGTRRLTRDRCGAVAVLHNQMLAPRLRRALTGHR